MAVYPALVQLVRMLGRADTLAALGVESEPEPNELSAAQRDRLSVLIDAQLENVASELIDEAAASDDVHDRATALQFIGDRIAGFRDLLTAEQVERLAEGISSGVADWG